MAETDVLSVQEDKWNNTGVDAIFHKSNMNMDFTSIQYQKSILRWNMKASFCYGIKMLEPLHTQASIIPPSSTISELPIAALDRVQVLIQSHVVCSPFINHKGWENNTIA